MGSFTYDIYNNVAYYVITLLIVLCIYDHLYLYKVHWAHFLHMPHLIYIGIHTYYCYIYYYIVHLWKSILSAKKHIWENLVQRRKDAYAKSAIPHSYFQLANVSTNLLNKTCFLSSKGGGEAWPRICENEAR